MRQFLGSIFLGVCSLAWANGIVHLQEKRLVHAAKEPLHPLSIGSRVPDFMFEHVLNFPKKQAHLSDFRAKLTILDFWSTSCGVCVQLFPRMDSLKDRFKGQVQVVLVNGKSSLWHDNEEKIMRTLKREEEVSAKTLSLPVVYESPELDSSFAYVAIPHEVWLDENLKIIAITGYGEVNEDNIRAILEGRRVAMHMKIDAPINLRTETLRDALADWGVQQRPEFASSLYKGYINGARGFGIRHDPTNPGRCTGIYAMNCSLLDLYEYAFPKIFSVPGNQVIVRVRDSSAFVRVAHFENDTSFYDNSWSYDLKVPPCSEDSLFHHFQIDLVEAIGARPKIVDTISDCLQVEATAALKGSFSRGGNPAWEMRAGEKQHYLRNYSIHDALVQMNLHSDIPIVDSTGMTQHIDMALPFKINAESALTAALEGAGFRVTRKRLPKRMVVVSDE